MKKIVKYLIKNQKYYLEIALALLIGWILIEFIKFFPSCPTEPFNWAEHLDYRYKPWKKAVTWILILILGSALFFKLQRIIRKLFTYKEREDIAIILSLAAMVLVGYIGYKIAHIFNCMQLFGLEFFDLTNLF